MLKIVVVEIKWNCHDLLECESKVPARTKCSLPSASGILRLAI